MSTLDQVLARRIAKLLRPEPEPEVIVEAIDYGNRLGVAIRRGDTRHAVAVQIDDGDLTKAADDAAYALTDWLNNPRS